MVDGVRSGGPVGASGPTRAGRRGADGGFSVETGARSLARTGGASGAAMIGMDSMLALQAVDEAQERDRRARKRGTAVLAALTDLQRAIVVADDPARALRSLRDLTDATQETASDPELAGILRAVTLRARVELARREVADTDAIADI